MRAMAGLGHADGSKQHSSEINKSQNFALGSINALKMGVAENG
jgi:hypothetical protein